MASGSRIDTSRWFRDDGSPVSSMIKSAAMSLEREAKEAIADGSVVGMEQLGVIVVSTGPLVVCPADVRFSSIFCP